MFCFFSSAKGRPHTSLGPEYDEGVDQILCAVGQVSVGCIMHLPAQGLSHPVQTSAESAVNILYWV